VREEGGVRSGESGGVGREEEVVRREEGVRSSVGVQQ
jgi:hypothetical protein